MIEVVLAFVEGAMIGAIVVMFFWRRDLKQRIAALRRVIHGD